MIFFFFSSSCTFFHTRERNGFSLSPSPVVGLTIPLTRLKFNYTCNPQRHRVKHREKTSIVFELRRERRDSRVTRMCVAARDTRTHYYCNNVSATASHYEAELPLFSRGHGFLHFRRGQRRRENVAKTSRIRLS